MVNFGNDKFNFESNSVKMEVERIRLLGGELFRALFSRCRKPIVVTKTFNNSRKEFWTSIPEGRQRKSEGVGKLMSPSGGKSLAFRRRL